MIKTHHFFLIKFDCTTGEFRQAAGVLPCTVLVAHIRHRRRWWLFGDYVPYGDAVYKLLRRSACWQAHEHGRWFAIDRRIALSLDNLIGNISANIGEAIYDARMACFQTIDGVPFSRVPESTMQAMSIAMESKLKAIQ